MDYTHCVLCPRECGVNREAGERGFCGCPDRALVAKTMLHKWEEPVLAGNGGSGAIFFGGCTLGCRYCQNAAISGGPVGKPADSAQLRRIMESLIAQGAENIDLVTPTHYLPTILPALSPGLPVPVVYNCGGYEKLETIRALKGLVDIYLPDLKYTDSRLALQLSAAPDYFPTAAAARMGLQHLLQRRHRRGAAALTLPVATGARRFAGTAARALNADLLLGPAEARAAGEAPGQQAAEEPEAAVAAA